MKNQMLIEWRTYDTVITTDQLFLGKNRCPNYKVVLSEILNAFDLQGVIMSSKIHFLKNHLDFFFS